MSDVFSQAVMNKEVCQEIVRTILKDNTIEVVDAVPQYTIGNLDGRGVRLDVFCKFSDGRLCDIEIQNDGDIDHSKRVQYNASCVAAQNTPKGAQFKNVPNIIVIYITLSDILKNRQTCSVYDCRETTTNKTLKNGMTFVFVNTEVRDGSKIDRLMNFFRDPNANSAEFPFLSQRTDYYKHDEKGRLEMEKIYDDYMKKNLDKARKEERERAIKTLFECGVDCKTAINKYPDVTKEKIVEIYKEATGNFPDM